MHECVQGAEVSYQKRALSKGSPKEASPIVFNFGSTFSQQFSADVLHFWWHETLIVYLHAHKRKGQPDNERELVGTSRLVLRDMLPLNGHLDPSRRHLQLDIATPEARRYVKRFQANTKVT